MEITIRLIRTKFQASKALANKISEVLNHSYCQEISALEIKFALTTGHLCFSKEANTEFNRILAAEDFINHIDDIVKSIENLLISYGIKLREEEKTTKKKSKAAAKKKKAAANNMPVPLKTIPQQQLNEIQRLLDYYPRGMRPIEIEQYDCKCPFCNIEMVVNPARSEYKCPECGLIREILGVNFDGYQQYSDNQKVKNGNFNPNRHFQFWWVHILACEPEEEIGNKDDPDNIFGEKLLDELRQIISRDKTKILRLLTVNDIRKMLRELDRTELNKNVPLILKKLTGVGPPTIPENIVIQAENYFTKAIEIRKRILKGDRTNRNYYPYYIYKILDQILENEEYRRILFYIYVQSKETVEADDIEWEKICLELDDIEYVPTDRTLAMKYIPK